VKDHDVWGDLQTANYAVTREFAAQNPKTLEKIVRAIADTYDWVNATPLEEVRAEMEKVIEKRNWPGEDPAVLQYFEGYGVAVKGGVIDEKSIEFWIDWGITNGDIKEGDLTPADVYTNEYNPYAK
jgi:ABC-type nitrate/sulfonate/bicarbonate transport system substrate-binding protein